MLHSRLCSAHAATAFLTISDHRMNRCPSTSRNVRTFRNVVIETTMGTITAEIDSVRAPITPPRTS